MSTNTAIEKEKQVKKYRKQSQFKEVWRRMRKNRAAMIGVTIFCFFVLVAIFADLIVPYQFGITNVAADRLQPPSAAHWFGTDEFGRDCFARVVHGARVSLTIGLFTSMISLFIGGSAGAIAGYYGGIIDSVIMRFMDVLTCIPGMLLSLAVIAAFGANLQNLLIAITVSSVPSMVRLVRATVLGVIGQDYIEAAKSYGTKDRRMIYKYIIPNALGPIIISTTMNVSNMILAAAALSFIGLGIQPPRPEWGAILSNARTYFTSSPYLLYFPGIAILLAALSLNLIGDGLRDALDPKLKD